MSSEIRLVKQNGESLYAHLESILFRDEADHLMVMVIDITQQRDLQRRIIELREQERFKIARDIHDGPVQALVAINFSLQDILAEVPEDKLAQSLKDVQTSIREQIRVLRNYSVELCPPMLAHLGLIKAIHAHAEVFQERHPEIRLQLELQPIKIRLSENIGVALYRIYQEAIANIAKHALPEVTKVTVRLVHEENQVRLEIQDNGMGFDLPDQWLDLVQEDHLGILGMRDRAEAIGGQLNIESRKGSGTHIWATVPLNHSPVSPNSA